MVWIRRGCGGDIRQWRRGSGHTSSRDTRQSSQVGAPAVSCMYRKFYSFFFTKDQSQRLCFNHPSLFRPVRHTGPSFHQKGAAASKKKQKKWRQDPLEVPAVSDIYSCAPTWESLDQREVTVQRHFQVLDFHMNMKFTCLESFGSIEKQTAPTDVQRTICNIFFSNSERM